MKFLCRVRVCSLLLGCFFLKGLQGQSHPYIIVKESEYDSLRIKSKEWPWSGMKTASIESARSISYYPEFDLEDKCELTFNLAGALSLAYLLDTINGIDYLKKAEGVVSRYISDIRTEKETSSDPGTHTNSVITAHAAFMVYIMMDIMYNQLDPEARSSMEQDCDFIATKHASAWRASKYSINAIMELYHHGVTEAFIENKNQYKAYLLNLISEDGVYTAGPGYTTTRLIRDERSQKKIFMDIAEYQGFNEFYSNPKFRALHEWIFGYAFSPFNTSYTFGDTPPTKSLDDWTAASLRSSRFSPAAQQNATWHLGSYTDDDIIGNILHFILCDRAPLLPMKPQSRIFKNGGAWLLDSSYHKESLTGVLWNINTVDGAHNHLDANSINICAFGEYILRNSGYDGWEEPDKSTWEWIHETAASSNTITFPYWTLHSDFRGGGITEGITGYDLEYASGNSGPSITTGTHDRNMLFVKPEEGLPGYFVLFDEIAALNPQYQIHMHLHPNSNNYPVIRDDGQVYKWVIKRCNTNKDVRVMICLGNDPVSSEIIDGYLASYDKCSRIVGKYLLTNFQPDNSGKKSITTLIYPYLGDQNIPSFNRIEVENCSGTAFKFNDEVSDYTFTSESPEEVIYRDVSFIANAVYMRMVNDDVLNYITRKGTRMLYQGNRVFGFESEKPVTIVCTGKTGSIISDSTNIIVFYPEIDNITLDNMVAEVLEEGEGWKKIFVPKGNHHFQIESPVSVTIQESDITTGERFLPEKQDNVLSILNFPNPFSVSTTVKFPNPSGKPYQMHLFDLSGKVVRMKAGITVNEFLLMRDGLEEGMYMIELKGEMVYRGKLLIE